jgi:hypothetical protein
MNILQIPTSQPSILLAFSTLNEGEIISNFLRGIWAPHCPANEAIVVDNYSTYAIIEIPARFAAIKSPPGALSAQPSASTALSTWQAVSTSFIPMRKWSIRRS